MNRRHFRQRASRRRPPHRHLDEIGRFTAASCLVNRRWSTFRGIGIDAGHAADLRTYFYRIIRVLREPDFAQPRARLRRISKMKSLSDMLRDTDAGNFATSSMTKYRRRASDDDAGFAYLLDVRDILRAPAREAAVDVAK